MWFYSFAARGVDIITRVICRRQVVGAENVPDEGPLLLVSNHLSFVDPPLLGAVFPRPIRFMAKEELFHRPVVSWVVRNYRAFPIRRGEADRQALQTTLRLLREGEVVGIFPEGTRSLNGAMAPAHAGAALIALRAGVPVIPVGLWGTEQMFRWPRKSVRAAVTVNIGKPFLLQRSAGGLSRELLAEETERIMRAVAELIPESYRGIYGPAADGAASLRQ